MWRRKEDQYVFVGGSCGWSHRLSVLDQSVDWDERNYGSNDLGFRLIRVKSPLQRLLNLGLEDLNESGNQDRRERR
jgi:hypothetical protein